MKKCTKSIWVVPVCNKKGEWGFLPKSYNTKGHANSAITNRKLDGYNHNGVVYNQRVYMPPIEAVVTFEAPDCDNCPLRFKCFTEK